MSARPNQMPVELENPARRKIVAAARAHFFSHGFRSVTMDDLAAELGISKKTLYACFESKMVLLEAVLRDKLRDVDAQLSELTATESGDMLDLLNAMIACVHQQTGEIHPAFVRDMRRDAPELFEVVKSGRRELLDRHFGRIFTKARKAGLIRKDIPVKVIIEILLATTDAIMNPAKLEELSLSPKAGYATIISVLLEGIMLKRGGTSL